jgi:N-acetylmuramoyl-L-alanine amidase
MYSDALAREQSVRAALAAPGPAPAVLLDVRAVVTAYEAVVRHYPASGYGDNALWQGGRLALDAFARFGQQPDKERGVRLLRKLTAMYPTSKLAARAPEQLARADLGSDDGVVQRTRSPGSKDQALQEVPLGPLATRSAGSKGPSPQAPVGTVLQSGPVATTRGGSLATIREIRRAVLPDAVRITIELDGEVPFHDERISNPARVFVDLPGTRAAPALVDQTIRFTSDADIVRQVRIGRHPNHTTRIVLDTDGVTSYSVYPLYSPYRLVIDCVRPPSTATPAMLPASTPTRDAPAAVSASTARKREVAPAPLIARQVTAVWLRRPPSLTPRTAALIAQAYSTVMDAPPIADAAFSARPASDGVTTAAARRATEPVPTAKSPDVAPVTPLPATPLVPPAKNLAGGFSIARQLGLGVSRIVIDAGHGGYDPGAKGKGLTEAELVLDVALRLETLLQNLPGVDVVLTRRTDEFIPLQERTAIANREGADLFLSIHANASPSAQARGIETYFLNFANNLSAAAVAARENAASSQSMGGLPDFVKAIALNNKLDESRDFAIQIQRSMLERLKTTNKTLKDLGVKQAPFVVLIGAAMPSVLAEISFVTNPQEAKLLKSTVYRQRIAESLFNAIRKYQTSLKMMPVVAPQ